MSKYNVLIADDEEMIRNGLVSLIEEDGDFNVVALAEDGEIALSMARETKPDVILADINMPFMNGLEFVSEIVKVLPDVTVVIVTGYDDFEYVKKALQLGAKDYILKPIMEEPFFELLAKIKEDIEKKRRNSRYISWGKEQIKRNRPMLIDGFINEWFNFSLDEFDVADKMHYLGIDIPDNWGLVMISMRVRYDNNMSEDLMHFVARNISEEILTPENNPISFVSFKGTVGIITKDLGDRVDYYLESIKRPIENVLGVKTFLAYSSGSSRMELAEHFIAEEEKLIGQKHFSPIIFESITIINEKYGMDEMSLQYVADKTHVSPQYLSRLFKSETGETFGGMLAKVRCDAAMAMLRNPEIKIYEIAEKCGYATQHYFSGAFKKATGMAPMDYRKKVCGTND